MARSVVDVAGWLREASLAGLIAGDGDRMSFRHDLIREAVYGHMLAAERRDLHRAAGDALAAAGASARQVAEQFERGGRVGDGPAIRWLERGADEVLPVSPAGSVELLEQAIALTPEHWPERVEAGPVSRAVGAMRPIRPAGVARGGRLGAASTPVTRFAALRAVSARARQPRRLWRWPSARYGAPRRRRRCAGRRGATDSLLHRRPCDPAGRGDRRRGPAAEETLAMAGESAPLQCGHQGLGWVQHHLRPPA
jgi:hypothetical protein